MQRIRDLHDPVNHSFSLFHSFAILYPEPMTLTPFFQAFDLPGLLFNISLFLSVSLVTLAYLLPTVPAVLKRFLPVLVLFLLSFTAVLVCDITGDIQIRYILQMFPTFALDTITHSTLLAPFPFFAGITTLIVLLVYRDRLEEKHALPYLRIIRTLSFLLLATMILMAVESYF